MKKVLGGLLLVVALLVGCGKTTSVDGVVVDKTYIPSNVTYSYGKSHKTHYHPAQYILLVQTPTKSGEKEVSADVYTRVKTGDHVRVYVNDVWGIVDVQP